MKKVAVILGSDSDWPVVKAACTQLAAFGIPYEAHILSAHRTPAAAADFVRRNRPTGGSGCARISPAYCSGQILFSSPRASRTMVS